MSKTQRSAGKAKVIATTFFQPPPPTPEPPSEYPRCVHEVPGEGRCPSMPMMRGYCHRHIGDSPWERANVTTLTSVLQAARTAMDDVGNFILMHYVVHGSAPIPEELQRDYRALWHRHNYISNYWKSRRVGDDLPAEVTMR